MEEDASASASSFKTAQEMQEELARKVRDPRKEKDRMTQELLEAIQALIEEHGEALVIQGSTPTPESMRAAVLGYALDYHATREADPKKVTETAAVFFAYITKGANWENEVKA